MSRAALQWIAGLLGLLTLTTAQAALQWTDGLGGTWRTAQEACALGHATKTLNALRAAQPGTQYRLAGLQLSHIDTSEFFCRAIIERRTSIIWVQEIYDRSVFGAGGADACHVPGLLDAATGLCGSPKCNAACGPTGCNGSNPINHATGVKYLRELDYQGVGNHPLIFERFYGSRELGNAALGSSWRHSYARSLAIFSDGSTGTVIATRHDGRVLTFTLAGGVATTDADVSERLQVVPQGSAPPRWVLTDTSDRRETYNGDGRLESIADRAGQTITFAYLTDGRLDRVRDQFGRLLVLSYDGSGRISGFTDPDNKVTTYSYDSASKLATVRRPDANTRQYLYNEVAQTGGASLPDALTGLIDETGTRYGSWTYDAQGRATSSRLGTGANVQRVAVTYNANGTSTVTDALGTGRVFSMSVALGVARLTGVSQPCAACGGATVQSQSFDAGNNPATRTDYNGNRTNTTYDARNLETLRVEGLTSAGVSTPRTRTTTNQWHPTWRLPQRVAEPKRLTTYIYNGDTDGGSTVTCGATGALCRLRIQSTTDLTGAAGFGTTLTGTPREWNFTYNTLGQRLTENGPRTDVSDLTTYVYNATTGNLTTIANALSQVTQFTSYDGNGRPLTLVDPNAVSTTFTYDYRGLLLTRRIDGQTTTLAYTPTGQLRQVTLPDGSFAQYSYDSARRLAEIADNLSNRRVFTRDDLGNVIREESLNPDSTVARSRARVFNALSRLEREIGAANQTTVFGYDGQGNLTSIQDPRSTVSNPIVTGQAYDELNRLARITDANQPVGLTQFTYDGLDQLLSVRAPNNATTTYTVDGLGNVTQEVSADRGTVNYTHDAAGNVRTRTDARGITVTFTYDALNRLISITYPAAGENVTLTYDSAAGSPACSNGVGRLCEVVDAGGTTRHAYDPRGNLLTVRRTELGQTYTTSYTYNGADRLLTLTAPTGKTLQMRRDAVGRMIGIDGQVAGAPVAFSTEILYDAGNAVRNERFGNGTRETTTIDADGRVQSTALTGGGGGGPPTEEEIPLPAWALALLGAALGASVLRARRSGATLRQLATGLLLGALSAALTVLPNTALAFDTSRTYDAANNLTGRTNAAGTFTYTYDRLNRLSSEAGPPRTQSFSYDPNGNRLTDASGSYTVAASSNRYATIRGSTGTYDAAGNLTALATGTPLSARTFTYNQAGRLTEVRQSGVLLATYTYNASGQRTRKALTAQGAQALGLPAAALTIVYHYDLAGNLLAETTSAGTAIRTYVWREAASGPIDSADLDTPIAQIEHPNNLATGGSNGSASETVLYFICDDLATPRSARNAAGQEVWRWASDAFGATAPNEDIDGNGQRTVVNLRLPGQYADAEAGLHYNWNRTYDPATGRYLESDPIGLAAGTNTFLYVLALPLRLSDFTGLSCAFVKRPIGGFGRDASEVVLESSFRFQSARVQLGLAPDAEPDLRTMRISPRPGVECSITGLNVWQTTLTVTVFYYQQYALFEECLECTSELQCYAPSRSRSNCRSIEERGERKRQYRLPEAQVSTRLVDFLPYSPSLPYLCTPLPFPFK